MLIKLRIRSLGEGVFEAKPWDGIQANDLTAEAHEIGNASYAPVLSWGSLEETRKAFDGMMSDLEFEALQKGKEVGVAMDENRFKQDSGYFSIK